MTMHNETRPAVLIGGPYDGAGVDVIPDEPEVRRPYGSWGLMARYLANGPDFVFSGYADPTDTEVKQELADAGIDMEPAYKRLHDMIERKRRESGEQ